jgi:hypothetical protein
MGSVYGLLDGLARPNDRIFTAGRVSDVVKCGRGSRDWAEVNPSDKVEGCERVVKR